MTVAIVVWIASYTPRLTIVRCVFTYKLAIGFDELCLAVNYGQPVYVYTIYCISEENRECGS